MTQQPGLTAERARELFSYEPLTGELKWRVSKGQAVRPGTLVRSAHSEGYIKVSVEGTPYLAHRLAWAITMGVWPGDQIDHRNGVRSDNRLSNLREVSHSVNCQNQRKAARRSRTGVLGVSHSGQRFRSQIGMGGRQVYLGLFDTPQEAHEAYLVAKREIHAAGCTI